MTKCEKCGSELEKKTSIITEFSCKYNIIEYKEKELYQCCECKDIYIR